MNNINQVLESNRFEVQNLLRRYKVVGPVNMETIQRAHDQHGANFMMKLLQIITPTENFQLESKPVDTKTLATSTAKPSENSKGSGWAFWDKLLTAVGATGEAIGTFKRDAMSEPADINVTPAQEAAQRSNTKMLYLVAAGFIALILIVLIFKK